MGVAEGTAGAEKVLVHLFIKVKNRICKTPKKEHDIVNPQSLTTIQNNQYEVISRVFVKRDN